METKVTSATKEVIIGSGRPTVIIGERINPSGKKKLSESLQKGEMDRVRKEAAEQVAAGADIIDVNVSALNVDEVTMLPRVVQVVMETVDVPICIDCANHKALDAALKVYKGKPLINSVTGEEASLNTILPMVKEYGAAVIGLVNDDAGIPKSVDRRIEIAHKIVDRAAGIGISREDIIIDVLVFSAGADTESGLTVLETIRRMKLELGVNLTLAVSNISFGLPVRSLINNAFVAATVTSGCDSLIADAAKIRPFTMAADLIINKDIFARRYTGAYRNGILNP